MGQLEHYMSLLWCPYVSNMSKVAATHHKCIDNDAALTLVWHTEGKAPQYVPLLFCSYDFAPMILNKNKDYLTLFEPHVRSTCASLGSYLSTIAAMHPTIIADNST